MDKASELGIPFEDVLPDLRPHSRGCEVKAWLADHPNVQRFAIVDDNGYEGMPLFQPNPYQGLSHEVAVAVEDYLVGRRNDDYRRSLLVRVCQYLKSFFEGYLDFEEVPNLVLQFAAFACLGLDVCGLDQFK